MKNMTLTLVAGVASLVCSSPTHAVMPTVEPSQAAIESARAMTTGTTQDAGTERRKKGRTPTPPLLTQVGTLSGGGLAAQVFEAAENVYSAEAADDFITPPGESWTLRKVRLVGMSSAPVPAATGAQVRVWASTGSSPADWMPGSLVCDFPAAAAILESTLGDVTVTLAGGCPLAGGTRYWISASVNQDFNGPFGGQWWWSEQTEATGDAGFVWRNPADGFGTGCVTWTRATTCGVVTPGSQNLRFELRGSGVKGDLEGDGYSDFMYQNILSRRNVSWSMAGATKLNGNLITPDIGDTSWVLSAMGDVNGDRHTDLIWQNLTSNKGVIWLMNGRARTTGGFIAPSDPGPGWRIVASGELGTTSADPTPDGRDDVLLWNTGTGGIVFWTMDGFTRVDGGFLPMLAGDPITADPASWEPRGIGDFDNDGHQDILFMNISTLKLRLWRMVNRTPVSGCDLTPDTFPPPFGFLPFAIGDVGTSSTGTPNGKADISFYNPNTGANVEWFMNGCVRTSVGNPNPVASYLGWSGVGPR